MVCNPRHGFTIIEILITIAIIGILASVVLPAVNSARDKALIASAKVELGSLNTIFGQMYDDIRLYPNGASSHCRSSLPANNEIDLSSDNAGLIVNGLSWPGWDGPYVHNVEDPWGNPYYLDEDYQCMASTTGCQGVQDSGNDSSVIVSCGPNESITDGSCTYDEDNIVYRLCDTG